MNKEEGTLFIIGLLFLIGVLVFICWEVVFLAKIEKINTCIQETHQKKRDVTFCYEKYE